MTIENTALISSSSRNKTSALIDELAKQYFNSDIVDDKTGFLAYVNDVLSDMFSDAQLHNSLIFPEGMINTAKFRSSVINKANDYSYKEPISTPEVIETVVGMKLTANDLIIDSYFELDPKKIRFIFGNSTYTMPGTVKIERSNGKWITSITDNTIFDYKIGQLSSQVVNLGTDTYITFTIQLQQLSVKTESVIIPFRNELSFQMIPFSVTDYFNGINIYRTDSNGNKILLQRIDNLHSIDSDLDKEIFLVEAVGDKTYNIVLDNGELFKFIPTGTELIFDIFETSGEDGRVKEPEFVVKFDEVDFNRSFIAYSILTSSGGSKSLDLNELKLDVIKHIQTPDLKTVVTEQDFANILSDYTGIDIREIVTIIRRNDPIERRTEIFLKHLDDNDEYLNLNTLSLRIPNIATLTSGMIDKGTEFVEELDGSNYQAVVKPGGYTPVEGEHLYKNLLTLKVKSAPQPSVSIYSLVKNEGFRSTQAYSGANYGSYGIFADGIGIKFNDTTNEYEVRLNLASNDQDVLTNAGIMANVKVRLLVSKKDSADRNFYIDAIIDPDGLTTSNYIAKFGTDAVLDDTSNLLVKDIYEYVSPEVYTLQAAASVELGREIDIECFIYYDDNTPMQSDPSAEATFIEFNTIFGAAVTNKFLFSKFIIDDVKMFEDLTETFSCTVETIANATDYRINLFPLISADHYDDVNNKPKIEEMLLSYNNLKVLTQQIKEEPSILSIKYHNTYGSSADYTTATSSDILFDLEISYNALVASSTIIDDIKTIIVDYINEKGSVLNITIEERNIYLSDITALIEDVIGLRQVRILNYSDNLYFQGYTNYKDISKSLLEFYVPASINVRKENISITVK